MFLLLGCLCETGARECRRTADWFCRALFRRCPFGPSERVQKSASKVQSFFRCTFGDPYVNVGDKSLPYSRNYFKVSDKAPQSSGCVGQGCPSQTGFSLIRPFLIPYYQTLFLRLPFRVWSIPRSS